MILLLYKNTQMEANAVLQTNWPAVVELAELLLAQGRVEGSDVHQIVETDRARSASISQQAVMTGVGAKGSGVISKLSVSIFDMSRMPLTTDNRW